MWSVPYPTPIALSILQWVHRSEQECIAPYAAAGAKAMWDALITRHFDATLQIRLLCEAFSVRRILALGQINERLRASAFGRRREAEQAAILALATEKSTIQHISRPAVSAFLEHTRDADETEWTSLKLTELLSEVLGRLHALRGLHPVTLTTGWDRANSTR
ncbi:hypothetical protein C8R45DRAFT_1093408 [Mycena sanguinolenta]|nr:hypothetical protein C8R45DRAFT_1093408 [Mycena sanguinolenta]